MRMMWTEGFGRSVPPSACTYEHNAHTALQKRGIYFSVHPTRLKHGSLFLTSLHSPCHQCKILHPCRQRQMESAAPAPCSAPVIYAPLAKIQTQSHTHTHTPIHPCALYAWNQTSADEIACLSTQAPAGDTQLSAWQYLSCVKVKNIKFKGFSKGHVHLWSNSSRA